MYHVHDGGKWIGPLTREDLKSLVRLGKVDEKSFVSKNNKVSPITEILSDCWDELVTSQKTTPKPPPVQPPPVETHLTSQESMPTQYAEPDYSNSNSRQQAENGTYFIQSEMGGPIKIGFASRNVNDRLSQLQTGRPDKLIVLGVIQGNCEKKLHTRFSHLLIRGEWFRAEKELLQFIHDYSLSTYSSAAEVPTKSEIYRDIAKVVDGRTRFGRKWQFFWGLLEFNAAVKESAPQEFAEGYDQGLRAVKSGCIGCLKIILVMAAVGLVLKIIFFFLGIDVGR